MFGTYLVGAAIATSAVFGTGAAAVSRPADPPAPPAAAAEQPADQPPAPPAGEGHAPAARDQARAIPRDAVHGQLVTRTGDGQYVTRTFARGVIDGLAVTSEHRWIEVKSPDGVKTRFVVTGETSVVLGGKGAGVPGTLTDLRTGDRVMVSGEGATPVAGHIRDIDQS